MQIDQSLPINHIQPNPAHQQQYPAQPQNQNRHSQEPVPALKPQLNQPQKPKSIFFNASRSKITQKHSKRSQHKKQTKSPTKNVIFNTYRSTLMQSIHNSNDLILVYLMYKQQKLSLFLNKGIPFEDLIRKMYKQIYIYEKQTYSLSNAILKNLLYKITGFESIDNDILYDYELKYKRGTLEQQKFFVPFKQQDHKSPFKIYTRIGPNSYGGNEFLARNYSDGEWIVISTIKKNLFDEEKLNIIKKSLKNNANACSLLIKNSSSNFSQINWLETKHYIIIVSYYFTQTLSQNLSQNDYQEKQCKEIFVYYAKWLASTFKQLVASNIQNFKKVSLQNIVLNPSDGQPKISIFDNVINCIDFEQKCKSVLSNGKRASQKIQDIFYFQTYIDLLKSLKNRLIRGPKSNKTFDDYLSHIEEKKQSADFTFDQAFRYFFSDDMNSSGLLVQKQKEQHPLQIDFTSKLSKIVENMHSTKANSSFSQEQTINISQIKEEIQKLFCMQIMRKNQQRNEAKSIIPMLGATSIFGDLKKQNIGNVTEFKKEQERKYNLKKKQCIYVQEILNELNHNENFIKTTKQNNVASIEFYLKKSDGKIKKKMVEKIEKKYKKFFDLKPANFEGNTLNNNFSQVNAVQECHIDDTESEFGEKSQSKHLTLPNCTKSRKNILADSYAIREQSHIQLMNNLLDKENFASQILSRLEQRSTVFKPMNMSLGKLNDSSLVIQKKSGRMQQLFISKKDYSKEEKIALKKKQYGIYLQEADKQFNNLRLYRKPKVAKASK